MKVITVATGNDAYYSFLQASAKKNKADLVTLGWNQKWQGYAWKFHLMKEYLRTLPKSEVVCFVDGYDVILLRSVDELEAAFRHISKMHGINMIVGCEGFSGVQKMVATYIFNTCNGRFINSGTYVGYAGYMATMFDAILKDYPEANENDQILLTQYCKMHPDAIYIDCDSQFFLTVTRPFGSFLSPYVVVNSNKQVVHNGVRPFIAHGNGSTNMNDLLIALGYDITPEQKVYLSRFLRKARTGKIIHYGSYFTKIVVIIVIGLYLVRRFVKR